MNSTADKSESPGGTGLKANLKTDAASLTTAENLGNTHKQIATLQAQFALHGHTLQTSTRANDGRETYTVSRWGQSRCFTSTHDLQAFLAQIGGAQ